MNNGGDTGGVTGGLTGGSWRLVVADELTDCGQPNNVMILRQSQLPRGKCLS